MSHGEAVSLEGRGRGGGGPRVLSARHVLKLLNIEVEATPCSCKIQGPRPSKATCPDHPPGNNIRLSPQGPTATPGAGQAWWEDPVPKGPQPAPTAGPS